MAVQDEINAIRRMFDTINRQAISNGQSLGKLTPEIAALHQELAQARQSADHAIQMYNDLAARMTALERK